MSYVKQEFFKFLMLASRRIVNAGKVRRQGLRRRNKRTGKGKREEE